jgi:hypothetical protein
MSERVTTQSSHDRHHILFGQFCVHSTGSLLLLCRYDSYRDVSLYWTILDTIRNIIMTETVPTQMSHDRDHVRFGQL